MRSTFFLTILTLSAHLNSLGQLKLPELSPAGVIKQNAGFTTIIVNYERPAARGRSESEIFGKLVPFGKVWRTGAGLCTRISFSTPVSINSKSVPKGSYSLLTIPDSSSWVVILNTDTTLNGAYSYDEKKDVVRLVATPQRTSSFYESLTIDIDVIPNDARVYISWLNTQVSFDVRTGTDEVINEYISTNLIKADSRNPDDYEAAISYYVWHHGDRKQMMKFINRGITLKDDRIWYYWKVSELMKDQKYDEALAACRTAIEVIRRSNEDAGYKVELIKDFEKLIADIESRKKK